MVSKYILFALLLTGAALGAGYIDPAKISADALSAICTIFSVLAGLILAIYALHISSIETAHNKGPQLGSALVWDSRKSVSRLSYFFWLYLIVLSLSLVVIVTESIPNASGLLVEFRTIAARLTIFFSILAAGMSFFVPLELRYIQERKILEAGESSKNSAAKK